MADAQVKNPPKYEVSTRVKQIATVLVFIGVIVALLGHKDPKRIWHAYLTAFFFFTSLALGGLFFTAIQHVVNAGWSVNVRRISESFTAFLPFAALGGLGLLFGASDLFHWTDTKHMMADPLLAVKVPYLNMEFFALRIVVFFGAWLFLGKLIVGNSIKQDESGDEKLTRRNVPLSIAFILIFALTYSLFSVDTLMSMLPHWYSTIFGVYCFSGLFQSTMALMILMAHWGREKGLLSGFVTDDHMHDLAKFLKAFTVFWAYIAFSQFMLIWYANIPEETEYYLHRSHGGWMGISVFLIFGKFIIPFIALLPRWAKRSGNYVKAICWWVLAMQFIDIFWMVYPNLDESKVLFGYQEIGIFAGFAGVFLFSMHNFLSKHSIIPVKDPRIAESTHHHVTY